ncbi:MAG TPA: hypothetical protein VMV18_04125 [bacterium]|nr:hypothetical protein [bacterium]
MRRPDDLTRADSNVAKTFDEVMQDVIDEESNYDSWDHDFTPNPYSPWAVARQLGVEEWAPQLIAALEGPDPQRSKWALEGIETLGPKAGAAAAAALERRGDGAVLFKVDEARARAIGVDADRRWRADIASNLWREGNTERIAAHLRHLLESSDPDVLAFALGGQEYPDESKATDFAQLAPELLPHERIVELSAHEDALVRTAAARLLGYMHFPGDAARVIDLVATGRATIRALFVDWVAPHPSSDRLIGRAGSVKQTFELVRRRRCAGLQTPLEGVRAIFHGAFLAPPAAPGLNNDRWRAQDIEYAALGCMELGDSALLREMVEAIGPVAGARAGEGYGAFEELEKALASFGAPARDAVNEALARASGEREERLRWMRDALAKRAAEPRTHPTLHDADERFAAGNLEDSLLVDNAAYGAYADLLRRHPDCAHAAFQLAWIDRAWGSPIMPERVEWLRQLGVRDHLLGELARPLSPADIVPGFRGKTPSTAEHDPAQAERRERAGLPSLAVGYWKKDPTRAALARDAALAHLERIRRASPPGTAP